MISQKWVGDPEEDQGSRVGFVAEARRDLARIRVHLYWQQAEEGMMMGIRIVSG